MNIYTTRSRLGFQPRLPFLTSPAPSASGSFVELSCNFCKQHCGMLSVGGRARSARASGALPAQVLATAATGPPGEDASRAPRRPGRAPAAEAVTRFPIPALLTPTAVLGTQQSHPGTDTSHYSGGEPPGVSLHTHPRVQVSPRAPPWSAGCVTAPDSAG